MKIGWMVNAIGSMAGKGKISKIVPFLDEGVAVTISRINVDYVMTGRGIVHLWGKTL